jgi:hypothetical protein
MAAGAALADDAVETFAQKLSYGVGLRTGGGFAHQDPANTGGMLTLDVRPYISGQVTPYLKFEGNLDLNTGDQSRIRVLDAVAKLEPTDLFNVWMGRFLPPSDRANLSGPYYQNAWNYPDGVNGFPSIYAGRADGGAVWGQVEGGRFKYQAGFFTLDPNLPLRQGIYAGRLVFNFLDPEPGYYNSSTYYGSKDVLALGGTVQFQKDGGGTAIRKEDLAAFNLDLLFEKKLAGNVVTLEGAYYNFNNGSQGQSFFALASFLLGEKVGPGRVQPMARWQQFFPTGGGDSSKVIDAGINYIIDSHNTRMAFVVQNRDTPGVANRTSVQLGVQIQE